MRRAGWLAPALLGVLAGAAPAAAAQARVACTLELVPEPAPGRLVVEVRVAGAPDVGSLELRFSGFGGWPHAEHEHLTELLASPPLQPRTPGDTTLRFVLPDDWDGAARAAYVIPLLDAEAGARHGLLPRRDGDLVAAIACNVLPDVLADGGWLDAERTLAVRAPESLWIVSGWADPVRGALDVAFPGADQCPLFFHPHPRVAESEGVQVVQLNGGEDTSAAILGLADRALDACAAATATRRVGPQRVFVTGDAPHVYGGMRTDRGVVMAWNPDVESALYRHALVHELFHEWLPGRLPADGPELVWFFEGFTQYASLWIAARAGLIPPEAFAERMLALDASARASAAHGQVAFADPEVAWRGGGDVERYAYDGGAVLAFHVDVALRRDGRTLAGAFGRWMSDPRPGYSLARLEDELRRAGASALFDGNVTIAAELPSTADALVELGFAASAAGPSLADPMRVRAFFAAAIAFEEGDEGVVRAAEEGLQPIPVAVSSRLQGFEAFRFDGRRLATSRGDLREGATYGLEVDASGAELQLSWGVGTWYQGHAFELRLGALDGRTPTVRLACHEYSDIVVPRQDWLEDVHGVMEIERRTGAEPLRLRYLLGDARGRVLRGEIEVAAEMLGEPAPWMDALRTARPLPPPGPEPFAPRRVVRVDGVLLCEGPVDGVGRRQGVWRAYDEDGLQRIEQRWSDGVPDGRWLVLDRGGHKCEERDFDRGRQRGSVKVW